MKSTRKCLRTRSRFESSIKFKIVLEGTLDDVQNIEGRFIIIPANISRSISTSLIKFSSISDPRMLSLIKIRHHSSCPPSPVAICDWDYAL